MANSLVTWGSSKKLGKLAGSEWVCPVGGINRLTDYERANGAVTDAAIKELASGVQQHVALTRYPEGYHAANVVESETGKVATDQERTYRYIRGMVMDVASVRPVSLGDGRQIDSIGIYEKGTETKVQPTQVKSSDPQHIDRLRTKMKIAPKARFFFLNIQGTAKPFNEEDRVAVMLRQNGSSIEGELSVVRSDIGRDGAQLTIKLGPDGQANAVTAYGRGFLEELGIHLDLKYDQNDWATVDAAHHPRVLHAMADLLGLGKKWKGLDLRRTGSNLYAAMGKRKLDLTGTLVPR